jgi:hypothetical protein
VALAHYRPSLGGNAMAYGSYCTQIDPSGSGGMRCGPASCASVLLDDGYQSDPWQLTLQLDAEIDPAKDGTTCQDLITLMDKYGLDGRTWQQWPELLAALEHGEAVLILCDNRYLTPRSYPSGASWEAMHWIRAVVASDRDDMVYVYDPLTWIVQTDGSVYQGPVASNFPGIIGAVAATAYWEAGVILTSRQGHNLNTR